MSRWADRTADPYDDLFVPRDTMGDGAPRSLSAADYDSFMRATDKRFAEPPSKDPRAWLARMKFMYPSRLRRMRRDHAWLEKMARKHGVNPEEVKWQV